MKLNRNPYKKITFIFIFILIDFYIQLYIGLLLKVSDGLVWFLCLMAYQPL